MFANVTQAGVLKSGTAVGAQRTGIGRYVVTFDSDLTGCAAVANAGFIEESGGAVNLLAVAKTNIGFDITPTQVSVWFDKYEGSAAAVDTDFHLIVVC
jgi:hypothetical protein